MEYQRITNLLENTLNQPKRFLKKSWWKYYDESSETYNFSSQIKFKIPLLRSGFCDHSDA